MVHESYLVFTVLWSIYYVSSPCLLSLSLLVSSCLLFLSLLVLALRISSSSPRFLVIFFFLLVFFSLLSSRLLVFLSSLLSPCRVCHIGGGVTRPIFSPNPRTPISQNFLWFPWISLDFFGFPGILGHWAWSILRGGKILISGSNSIDSYVWCPPNMLGRFGGQSPPKVHISFPIRQTLSPWLFRSPNRVSEQHDFWHVD